METGHNGNTPRPAVRTNLAGAAKEIAGRLGDIEPSTVREVGSIAAAAGIGALSGALLTTLARRLNTRRLNARRTRVSRFLRPTMVVKPRGAPVWLAMLMGGAAAVAIKMIWMRPEPKADVQQR